MAAVLAPTGSPHSSVENAKAKFASFQAQAPVPGLVARCNSQRLVSKPPAKTASSQSTYALPSRCLKQFHRVSKEHATKTMISDTNSQNTPSFAPPEMVVPSSTCSTRSTLGSASSSPFSMSSRSSDIGTEETSESPLTRVGLSPAPLASRARLPAAAGNRFGFGAEKEKQRTRSKLQDIGVLLRQHIDVVDRLLQKKQAMFSAKRTAGAAKSTERCSPPFCAEKEAAREDLTSMVNEIDRLLVDPERADVSTLRGLRDRLVAGLNHGRTTGLAAEDLSAAARYRRTIQNTIDIQQGRVRTYCRLRPLTEEDLQRGEQQTAHAIDDTTLEMQGGERFTFNSVFAPGSQEEIFEETKDLIHAAIDGRNSTVLSYGPTGSGKTHTLFGPSHGEQDGIAFRTGAELFEATYGHRHRADVSVRVAMFEVYNNNLNDLLVSAGRTKDSTKPALRPHANGGVSVEGIKEVAVENAAAFSAMVRRGLSQRVVAANSLNARSSRSHLILTIKVQLIDRESGQTTMGKIRICDLAGSERLKMTAAFGEQRREAIEINKSLTALGDVIQSVALKRNTVPYRNHKLTRLLQDSLDGSARTLVVVGCLPQASRASEMLIALKFASRFRTVTNSTILRGQ
eukprot:TRINITY_DN74293_c0_g1_i1.p1 TRINITY_DN74293_c0_g1~~TRINITY_DN74293_c0_g1_i1.p1  ORF type:complete len:627 (-),score=86.92 TRINITY_DN74293_c0_g1_i1:517-2397(-)